MDIAKLSSKYTVRPIEETDVGQVYAFCLKNPQFYLYCPPEVTEDGIRRDMRALPEGKTLKDKYYLGFWDGDLLVAVVDLILGFPNAATAFIGFFMVNADLQGRGVGSRMVGEMLACLSEEFSFVRLGYSKDNPQSKAFWLKNGFTPTGVVAKEELYDVVIMEKKIN